MESNTEENTTGTQESAEQAAEKPARRRASRRVTAAAAEPTAAEAPAAEAPAAADAPSGTQDTASGAPEEAAPKKRATRSRKKVADTEADSSQADSSQADASQADSADAGSQTGAQEDAAPKKRATRSRKKTDADDAQGTDADAADGASSDDASSEATQPSAAKRGRGRRNQSDNAEAAAAGADATTGEATNGEAASGGADTAESAGGSQGGDGAGDKGGRNGNRRGRGRSANKDGADTDAGAQSDDDSKSRSQSQGGERAGSGKNGDAKGGDGKNDNSQRSTRTRQRDRKRRGQNDDSDMEITEDDVLLPIAGILDVLDNYAFVRTSGYLPGTSDVYVSLGQVKKYGLRRGDAVVGAIRQPREGDNNSRQKYNAIVKIDSVNGRSVEEEEKRAEFSELTPVYPQQRLRLETTADRLLGRAIDIAAPLGLGQRALISLPAKTSGATLVGELAEAISTNLPQTHLVLVLSDALPEEITRLQRSVRGEVVAASFDRPSEDQATIAELAIDRARRLVELGHDVIVLVDSLNRLTRAYAQAQQTQSRPGIDEVDAFAIGQLRRLLAAGRNVENGGSLTLIATAHVKTGIAADKVILREARAVVNAEIKLTKPAHGQQPEVDLLGSWVRGASSVVGEAEGVALGRVRESLTDAESGAKLLERLRASSSNAALLAEVQRAGRLA